MSDVVIKAESLGKKYTIGHQANGERYTALRDVVMRSASRLWRKTKDMASGRSIIPGDSIEEFWALKDVSFEIKQGEAVGIIGRNGAGKSTLLKVLSRITEPSAGRVTIKGRVASLLEVGTGFHPELSGRENIFLNGAVLGMTRREIKAKFDEIIDFAEVEKFLDTPVKRYSSGMYVRLAFAVAAHLEPEVMLVDEVLAVGDAVFQRKCLGKMGNVAESGTTVLFVSHNMAAIEQLCSRACLISRGALVTIGKVETVIEKYLTGTSSIACGKTLIGSAHKRSSFTEYAIKEAWLQDEFGNICDGIRIGASLTICYRFEASRNISGPGFGFGINARGSFRLITANNYVSSPGTIRVKGCQKGIVSCRFDSIPLLPGIYTVSISLVESGALIIDYIEHVLQFHVIEADFFGSGKLYSQSQGIFAVPANIYLEE